MASGSRRRKKQKRRGIFPWALAWFLLFLGVTGAGLMYSDITEPRVARIEAPQEYERERIEKIVRALKGVPALRISGAKVEREIEQNGHVATSVFRANVFGRASLTVWYRHPVAMVEGEVNLAIDEFGAAFKYPGSDPPAVVVERNEQAFIPIFTICDPSRLRPAGELAKNLQVLLPKLAGKIALDSRGALYLRTGDTEVVFGGGDRLPEKVAVLARELDRQPNLLESYSINLVEPERPMQERVN